ncbi:MAG: hypothetical protein ACUVXB_04715 [Bryobacteraceae bacterium]
MANDFAFFASDPSGIPPVRLVLDQEGPDYDGLAPFVARFCTPRNVVYREGGCRILDFGGRGVAR